MANRYVFSSPTLLPSPPIEKEGGYENGFEISPELSLEDA